MADRPPALDAFSLVTADWFTATVGTPTVVQATAWPAIAAGEHVLVSAPTGSGKTLAAFLFAIDQLLTGAWPLGTVRCLYISPLKALNNDIRRNLLQPLAGLRRAHAAAGRPDQPVGVMTRSGDTSPALRRQMVRQPPEILITTPESLNLLLDSPRSRGILSGVRTVILDEIHAVAGNKRGTHLITAVDRLVPLAGEFQRIALSATVTPLETVAAFVGGYTRVCPPDGEPSYHPRPVTILRDASPKTYDLSIVAPLAEHAGRLEQTVWHPVADALRERILAARSTLVFCNSRRLAERLTALINAGSRPPLAWSHHGSLSRELRQSVEQRLKAGELRAIVATASLELGIDIGALDQVLMVETPFEVSAAAQRLGRAGHGVGEVSRGAILCGHGRDLIDAIVVREAVLSGDIEPLQPVVAPLDLLAQLICAMCAVESHDVDGLYGRLRTSWPYHRLTRRQYDAVIELLDGRYAASRLPALQPRLSLDRVSGRLRARAGALQAVYASGGTIPDRGYFTLRHAGTGARLGELDEEFVWEQRVGTVFALGAQSWRLERVTDSDVLVSPAASTPYSPFWRGEPVLRSHHLASRVGACLAELDQRLDDAELAVELTEHSGLEPAAAEQLLGFLRAQCEATGCRLPHQRHLVAELIADRGTVAGEPAVVIHTCLGGRVNRPLALALAGWWARRHGTPLQVAADNTAIGLLPEEPMDVAALLHALDPDEVEDLLRSSLDRSGFFGARFRENAARALLLPRGLPGRRVPLWLTRARAKQLLEAVSRYPDFPIVAETWRTCLQDEFDLPALRETLAGIRAGAITVSQVETAHPSPFAEALAWSQTNVLMYADDTPTGAGAPLSEDLLRELVFSDQLRPTVPEAVIAEFQAKLHRTHPGYAPTSPEQLLDHLFDRLVIAGQEWPDLLAACQQENPGVDLTGPIADRVVRLRLPGAAVHGYAARDRLPELAGAVGLPVAALAAVTLAGEPPAEPLAGAETMTPAELIGGWLTWFGPVPPARLAAVFGLAPGTIESVVAELTEARRVVVDRLRDDGGVEVCDADNLERLLRLARRARRPSLEPLPAAALPLFLAQGQGLCDRGRDSEGAQAALEPLLGYSAPVELWETELLPARLADYRPSWLDALFAGSDLLWLGRGERLVTFCFPDQLELLAEGEPPAPTELLPPGGGRYRYDELLAGAQHDEASLTAALWAAAWRGEVSGDSFALVRNGLATDFQPPELQRTAASRAGGGLGRGGRSRWESRRPVAGAWQPVVWPSPPADPIDVIDLERERVRLLLDRYGILFRELLAREAPPFGWGQLFRAMRLMELAGELVAGSFFAGIGGVQFIAPETVARLRRPLPEEAIWQVAAADPASPCGLRLDGLDQPLPERRAGNLLVYHGRRLVLVARRQGRDLTFSVAPDEPLLPAFLEPLHERLCRAVAPLKSIAVMTVNGTPATTSPYLPAFRQVFDAVVEPRQLRLWRRRD